MWKISVKAKNVLQFFGPEIYVLNFAQVSESEVRIKKLEKCKQNWNVEKGMCQTERNHTPRKGSQSFGPELVVPILVPSIYFNTAPTATEIASVYNTKGLSGFG